MLGALLDFPDLRDDPEVEAERAVGLGATRLADGPTWITLADPAGHPFDLCQTVGVGPVMGLFAVTIDAPDASALARFYAEPVLTRVPGLRDSVVDGAAAVNDVAVEDF